MPKRSIVCLCLVLWAALALPAGPAAAEPGSGPPASRLGLEHILSLGRVDDETFIMWVGLATDEHGRLFVSDALDFSVKVFSPDGLPLLKAGRFGTGPGEFGSLRELAVSRDGVYVLDQQKPGVLVFDKQLRFQRTIPQTRPISCLRAAPDGTLAAALVPVGKGQRPSILLADGRGRTLGEVPFGADIAHPAGDRASFVLTGRDIVLAYHFKNKVERLDRSGRVIWSRKPFDSPDSGFKSVLGQLVPSEFIFKDIAVDRAGRLYVLAGGTTEHPSRDIYVLGPSGETIGLVVLPDTTHLVHIDSRDFLYSRAHEGATILKQRVLFPGDPGHDPRKGGRP